MPWYRKLALVVLFPFALLTIPPVLAILLLLGLYAVILNIASELCFRARMQRCRRFLDWRKLGARIAEEGPGTLIIEIPSLGWGFTHAWWTPDAALALSPYAAPTREDCRRAAEAMQCLDWDRWHWANYTNPDNGKAFLLRVWNGRSLEKWVRKTYPSVDVVQTWTALVHPPYSAPEPG